MEDGTTDRPQPPWKEKTQLATSQGLGKSLAESNKLAFSPQGQAIDALRQGGLSGFEG